jgi:hypothetical protein
MSTGLKENGKPFRPIRCWFKAVTHFVNKAVTQMSFPVEVVAARTEPVVPKKSRLPN